VLRAFLRDFFVSNDNEVKVDFLVKLLGITTPNPTSDDILKAIDNFDSAKTKVADIVASLNTYWQDYFSSLRSTPIPPATCGNGKSDQGETLDNCIDDLADVSATCGKGICITSPVGESLLNCPRDCLPGGGTFLKACSELIDQFLGGEHPHPRP